MDCATQQDLRKTMSSSLKRRLTADSGSKRNFQHQQISLCASSDTNKHMLECENWTQFNFSGHWKTSVYYGITCNFNKTKPYLKKINIPRPNTAVGPDLDNCCQITNFESYQNLEKPNLGPLKFTCVENWIS